MTKKWGGFLPVEIQVVKTLSCRVSRPNKFLSRGGGGVLAKTLSWEIENL